MTREWTGSWTGAKSLKVFYPFKMVQLYDKSNRWVKYDSGKDDQWTPNLESQSLMSSRILTLSQIPPLNYLLNAKNKINKVVTI